MADLLLYLGLAFVGFLIGAKAIKNKEKFSWLSKVQTISIFLLIFTMGTRMGSNREVIDNIGTIGLTAIVYTFAVFIFVVLGLYLTRKVMGMNKEGELNKDITSNYKKEKVKFSLNKTTLLIIVAVILGMLFGYFVILSFVESDKWFEGNIDNFSTFASNLIRIELSTLLLLVGIDLGFGKEAFSKIKKMGLRVLIFPVVNMIFTLLAGALTSLLLGMEMREGILVTSGFAWYSLAPGIIMDAGLITISAISFIHNVSREMFAIILIPIMANNVGYIETIGLPGAASMDVCLPIIERATKPEIAIYGFVSGVILSLAVPILVPILISILF